jgi:hypothetical protein
MRNLEKRSPPKILCADGPITSLVELSLATEHRRGHASLYDGLNQGRIDIDQFRNVVATNRSHVATTAGSCWPSTSVTGYDLTRTPAPNDCSATPTPAAVAGVSSPLK